MQDSIILTFAKSGKKNHSEQTMQETKLNPEVSVIFSTL